VAALKCLDPGPGDDFHGSAFKGEGGLWEANKKGGKNNTGGDGTPRRVTGRGGPGGGEGCKKLDDPGQTPERPDGRAFPAVPGDRPRDEREKPVSAICGNRW